MHTVLSLFSIAMSLLALVVVFKVVSEARSLLSPERWIVFTLMGLSTFWLVAFIVYQIDSLTRK